MSFFAGDDKFGLKSLLLARGPSYFILSGNELMNPETENPAAPPARPSTARLALTLAAIVAVVVFALAFYEDAVPARATLIAGICLVLWLSEIVPAFVPTFALWALTVVLLGPLAKNYAFGEVLAWAANPVLILFFGGFSFGVAASRYGLDVFLARLAVKFSRRSRLLLVVLTAGATAFMSMWLSNIAAAAMMIAALHPLTRKLDLEDNFRRALLIAVAVGANFGGIATPIGTGPNAIAISAVEKQKHVTFAEWMSFALPLTLGLLLVGTLMIKLIYRVKGEFETDVVAMPAISKSGKAVVAIFAATIFFWLTEPLHCVSSPVVALIAAAILFGSGLLRRRDLNEIDWGTIALIAGGISLGNLLESAGLIEFWAHRLNVQAMPLTAQIFVLCFASALLSALMSNTATVTMLIPFAAALIPDSSVSVLVAVAASLGIPFVISTPINAMVHGEGGVRAKDFFVVGFPLMIGGCLLLALTGLYVLSWWFK
jgi:solute carrier family 13 (sodium-dependent dicarboxylate transporter), member 2/3/5